MNRVFFLKKKRRLSVYADKVTKKYLLNSFSYCFKSYKHYPAILNLLDIKNIIIPVIIFIDFRFVTSTFLITFLLHSRSKV